MILSLVCLGFPKVWAQRAKYAAIPVSYDLTIPEKTGNFVHAWASSSKQSYTQSQNTTLTLYIFSQDIRLLARKYIQLGRVNSWNIQFEYSDSCYYASIYYRSDSLYHIQVKVDYDGTVTDASSHWPRLKTLTSRQLHKIFALEHYRNYIYSIKIESTDTAGGSQDSNFISLDKESITNRQHLQKIIIKKVNSITKEETGKVYVSALQNFWYPFIQVTDTSVFAYSFAEYTGPRTRNNQHNDSYMFVVRLDAGLNSTTPTAEMIRLSGPVKHKSFSPYNVFVIDNKTFIVNRGWDPDGVSYFPVTYNRAFGYSRVLNMNLTNSFRITVLDNSNALLKDTIIEDRSGDAPLRWDNRFITASDKYVDLFFTRQFRASKNGMTHLYVNNEGKLTEDNIIVEERYEYYLSAARKLTEGVLLVPYGKNGRTIGIMRMQYDTGSH